MCTGSGNIDVNEESALLNTATDSFGDLKTALRARGYDRTDRKYLVFADWTETGFCGRGDVKDNDSVLSTNPNNSGNMFAVVFMATADGCAFGLNMLHEIGHTMGAVQKSAPRHDNTNDWHPRDEYDRMAFGSNTYASSTCSDSTTDERRLDCNKNDYFDPDPTATEYLATHWNTANNRFLVG